MTLGSSYPFRFPGIVHYGVLRDSPAKPQRKWKVKQRGDVGRVPLAEFHNNVHQAGTTGDELNCSQKKRAPRCTPLRRKFPLMSAPLNSALFGMRRIGSMLSCRRSSSRIQSSRWSMLSTENNLTVAYKSSKYRWSRTSRLLLKYAIGAVPETKPGFGPISRNINLRVKRAPVAAARSRRNLRLASGFRLRRWSRRWLCGGLRRREYRE